MWKVELSSIYTLSQDTNLSLLAVNHMFIFYLDREIHKKLLLKRYQGI